jgi:hypothetical protein
MMTRSRLLLVIGAAMAGWLGLGAETASAQTIYVDPYPVVLPPVSTYIVTRPVIAPAPIVRERTVVVSRHAYWPAPVYRPPLPPYGYVAEEDYVAPGW